jgi:hypothetical protein
VCTITVSIDLKSVSIFTFELDLWAKFADDHSRAHLFCTWGAEGAAAYATYEGNLVEVQAYSVADGKVVE